MNNIQDKIWNYGFLEPHTRVALELYVQQHTSYVEMLEDAKSIYALMADASLVDENAPGDLALVYYVAQESVPGNAVPEHVVEALKMIKNKVEADDEVHERYVFLKNRMEQLAENSDPMRRFEEITGHDLAGAGSSGQDQPASARGAQKAFDAASDRPPLVRERSEWAHVGRKIVYGVLVVLIVASSIRYTNRFERRAFLAPSSYVVGAIPELRGHERHWAAEDRAEMPLSDLLQADLITRFAGGVRLWLRAQHVRFGFYYYFEQDKLQDAEAVFRSILVEEGLSNSLKDEVKYVLARVLIARQEYDAASSLLEEVESAGGAWADAAGDLRQGL